MESQLSVPGYGNRSAYWCFVLLDFSHLLDNFEELRAQADALESSNPEDHRRIKLAIVGFAQSSDWNHWAREHLGFIEGRLQHDLSQNEFSDDWIDFSCLAMGYILGCFDCGKITTDVEYRTADAQLPGFMWLHAERFSSDPSE
ncbi:hypothetical protein [Roseimaritima ulvae]|uniref:Uncharacterized protein n=1 Tax=Roseimaritima ulvae TaxID=980254 RepID=A0A5B9QQI7_9BACT|nr:hypothetical protein [Roseimaritima ulvae]QEG40182.1 hypothetical protein UC8_21880 [Roseimaritima ulvae]